MNMQQIMKQAQSLQKKMQDMQGKMAEKEVIGSSGGGMVEVTVTCNGNVKKVRIAQDLLVPAEVEVLEDLIVAAINNAKAKADQASEEEMKNLGISPDMLKMPF